MLDQYILHTMGNGDVTDEQVASWSSSTPGAVNGPLIKKITVSGPGNVSYGITLFWAAAVGDAVIDIVPAYSTDAMPITLVNPNANGAVPNVTLDCPEGLRAPRFGANGLTLPTLRVSTSGKVGTGVIRVIWSWGDPL